MECFSPIRLKQKGSFQDVSCSKCQPCQINYKNGWINRSYVETRYSKTQAFFCLTVEDKHLQFKDYIDKETGEIQNLQCITKKRLQDFHKRLRKKDNYNHKKYPLNWTQKENPIKYLGIGEFGENTHRQHYHDLVWNLHPLTKEQAEKIWGFGHVDTGHIQSGSIAYIVNHQLLDHKKGMHPEQKPFSLKSNNIGMQYIAIHQKSHSEGRQWFLSEMKTKMALPTGYRRKLFPEKKTEHMKLKLAYEKRKRNDEIEYKAGRTIQEINQSKILSNERRKKFFNVGKKRL